MTPSDTCAFLRLAMCCSARMLRIGLIQIRRRHAEICHTSLPAWSGQLMLSKLLVADHLRCERRTAAGKAAADGAGAFCELCGVRQPRRCKHCHDCGRCVAVFDHHCAWLGNCVGARNRCV